MECSNQPSKMPSRHMPAIVSFIGLPSEIQEKVICSLGTLGSDQKRSATDAARDILQLGSTCKHMHKLQKVGIHHLAASCPEVAKEEVERSKHNTQGAVSNRLWDKFLSRPSQMDKEQLKDMIALLPGTGLLHDVPLNYKKELVAAYTDRYAKKSDIVFVLRHIFGHKEGIRFPTGVPARVVAAIQRTRKVECLKVPRSLGNMFC